MYYGLDKFFEICDSYRRLSRICYTGRASRNLSDQTLPLPAAVKRGQVSVWIPSGDEGRFGFRFYVGFGDQERCWARETGLTRSSWLA